MLKEFTVQNFKNFKNITLNFGNTGNYDFKKEVIKNNIISKMLILGKNGSGKSNVGLAIFDIINHLTDKEKKLDEYRNYLNYNQSNEDNAFFCYIFQFGSDKIKYEYKKIDSETIIEEKLFINDKLCIEYNKNEKVVKIEIEEYVKNFQNFNKDLSVNEFEKISLVKYIKRNTLLIKEAVLYKFFEFVDNMLWIRSLQEGNTYMGYENGNGNIMLEIIKAGKVKDFENFFKKAGINQKLVHSENQILIEFESGIQVEFYQIASSGTKILALLFFWMEIFIKNVSFLFIDEFDAYFHHSLSKFILERLFSNDNINQIALSSHSTNLIDNEILRPDCYFVLNDKGKIKQFSEITDKKIEEYHNIEKL